MGAFEIRGGKPLKGEIIPQGAKNEALQVISAVLLTEEKITISNIPDIVDVNKLIELLGDMGVSIEQTAPDTYTFEAKNINLEFFHSPVFNPFSDFLMNGQSGRVSFPAKIFQKILYTTVIWQN